MSTLQEVISGKYALPIHHISDCRHDARGLRLRSICAYTVRLLAISLGLLISSVGAHAADKYRAFYYNDKGQLLQVEQVPDSDVSNRALQDLDGIDVPQIRNATREKISGSNIPMSKVAAYAIYYSYSGTEPSAGTANVRAYPALFEDLQFVPSRSLAVCLPKSPNTPCSYPQRCHCAGTANCCCW